MNGDSELYAERLRAAYESEAPRPPADVVVPDAFWYVHFKAFAFLMVGPDQYRSQDALRQPPENLPATRLDRVNRGCEQILQFRGLSAVRPLEGIGVDGFYALLPLISFCTRSARRAEPPNNRLQPAASSLILGRAAAEAMALEGLGY